MGSGVGVSVSGVDGEGETLGDGVAVVLVEEVGETLGEEVTPTEGAEESVADGVTLTLSEEDGETLVDEVAVGSIVVDVRTLGDGVVDGSAVAVGRALLATITATLTAVMTWRNRRPMPDSDPWFDGGTPMGHFPLH